MTINEAATLITSPLGELFYRVALILVYLVFLAFLQTSGTSGEDYFQRWTRIALTLLIAETILLLFSVFSWFGWIDLTLALPILDRFLSLATMLLAIWGILVPRRNPRADRVVTVLLLLVLIATVAALLFHMLASDVQDFNRTYIDAIWSVVAVFVSISAAIALAVQRPRGWLWGLVAFSLLFIGYLLHMTLGPREADLPAFSRWAELAAFPMLLIAAIRGFPAPKPIPAPPPSPPSQQVLTYETEYFSLPEVLSDLAGILGSDTIEDLVYTTVRSIAQIMKAEICLLLTSPEPLTHFSIARGFDLISERYIDGRSLDAQEFPVIVNSLRRKRSLVLPLQSKAPDILAIQETMGLSRTGPALLSPMVADDKLQGGLLLLSPFARVRWSEGSRDSLDIMARILAKRFNSFEAAPDEPTEIGESTRKELTEALEQLGLVETENARLVEQLKAASSQDGYDLESLLNSQQMAEQTITTLESEVERLKTLIADQDSISETEQVEYLASQLQVVLQELAEARARIAAMEHLQGQPTGRLAPDLKVITSLSQDLRKPMSALLSYTELMQSESPNNLNQKQAEYLNQIHRNTIALASLLNNLIHVTAIETGTLELHPIPVDLQSCIEEAVSQTSTALRKKNLALQMDLRDNLPAVLGDEDALLQVFVHLLNNAIGASPEGERIHLTSHTASSDSSQYLTVTITDHGGGIPPEDLGKVFDPIYESRGLTIIGIGETSIGLSIVRSLMEAMGGRIWVDSQLGSGSSFTVLIPLSA